jgi:3-deoxy-7-phosphoheptulonate synthase
MILKLAADLSPAARAELLRTLRRHHYDCRALAGFDPPAIGILGGAAIDEAFLRDLEGVAGLVPVPTPFKLAGRAMHPADTRVAVGDVVVGADRLTVIAGPCAVESRGQIMAAAAAVRRAGAVLFRGGAFKPRTSPYAFQGLQEEGLRLLAEVREATGMPVVSEMTATAQADLMMKYIDLVQIGARNMQNFELLKCVGRMGKPVLLKRGLSATIQEWLMSAEYILSEGNPRVILCERGIRTFEPYTRNTLDLTAIPVLRNLTHLPIIIDPSHATGIREKVAPMARAAIAAGADGLMIEVHPDPDRALSDGPQSLYPDQFAGLMRDLYVIAPVVGKQVDFGYLDKAAAIRRLDAGDGARRRAAFIGRIGTFSHKACMQYFGERVEAVPMHSFTDLFEAVTDGRADFGIVPIENSLSGSIHQNYDHLLTYDLKIIGEIKLRIVHLLMARPGTRITDVRRVLSHPQVFGQCLSYLDRFDWERVAVSDTAGAAERVAGGTDAGDAAIANRVAAEIYGLEILAEGIETNPRNYTRFVVVGRQSIEGRTPQKSSIICAARNEPGALYAILQIFAENRINMIKLESRPMSGEPWRYMFYIDLEANLDDPGLAPVRQALAERAEFLKLLGSY